jgi:hypothetical protein
VQGGGGKGAGGGGKVGGVGTRAPARGGVRPFPPQTPPRDDRAPASNDNSRARAHPFGRELAYAHEATERVATAAGRAGPP